MFPKPGDIWLVPFGDETKRIEVIASAIEGIATKSPRRVWLCREIVPRLFDWEDVYRRVLERKDFAGGKLVKRGRNG